MITDTCLRRPLKQDGRSGCEGVQLEPLTQCMNAQMLRLKDIGIYIDSNPAHYKRLHEFQIIGLGSVRKVMSQTPHGTSQRDHRSITSCKLARRVTIRRLSFNQPNIHSIMLRCRYLGRSKSLGNPGFGLRFMLRRGITGCIRYRSQ